MNSATTLSDMQKKKYFYIFLIIIVIITWWKLTSIETGLNTLQFLKNSSQLNKVQLEETNEQILRELIELHNDQYPLNKQNTTRPTIFAITPTYARYVQKAELTRISQTLMLVPNVHWIVVEDAPAQSALVRGLLAESRLRFTHLAAATPSLKRLKATDARAKPHRGVSQRNEALRWLRDAYRPADAPHAVVYFMDDDNTYSRRLFDEIAKVRAVGVWPVGLVGGFNVETPVVRDGRVTGFVSGWRRDRPFAIDMAGFAIHLRLILAKPEGVFSYLMEKGFLESEFLAYFTTLEELEPLAENCTKVYVWHTRTTAPSVSKNIPGIEV